MTKYNSAKVLIIVNVASNCGYTYSNYRELVDIYDKYHGRSGDSGLSVEPIRRTGTRHG